jgi:hypothetical protein
MAQNFPNKKFYAPEIKTNMKKKKNEEDFLNQILVSREGRASPSH